MHAHSNRHTRSCLLKTSRAILLNLCSRQPRQGATVHPQARARTKAAHITNTAARSTRHDTSSAAPITSGNLPRGTAPTRCRTKLATRTATPAIPNNRHPRVALLSWTCIIARHCRADAAPGVCSSVARARHEVRWLVHPGSGRSRVGSPCFRQRPGQPDDRRVVPACRARTLFKPTSSRSRA